MDLTLRCPRANSSPTDKVRNVLRRNHVEVLDACGYFDAVQFDEKLPACAQTFVDLKAAIQLRVVDQTLPADSSTWFLEIHTHDDQKVGLKSILFRLQFLPVVHCRFDIVNRTRSDDDDQA